MDLDTILKEAGYTETYDLASVAQEGKYSKGIWIDIKVSVDNWDTGETDTEMVFLSKADGESWIIDGEEQFEM